jgi:short-subunit dehydrogenase
MVNLVRNKVVVITGASSGIGAALAVRAARQGAHVVLAARRKDRLADVAAAAADAFRSLPADQQAAHDFPPDAPPCLAITCDVTNRNEAEELIHSTARTYGRIDVLVNNAGRGHMSSFEDTTDAMIESMFRVNVYALWYTTRPALAIMRKQESGHIINVSSIAGKIGFPYNSAYVAAKHAVVGLTHALRLELMETGIHATVVCPAGVPTEWAEATEGGAIQPLFSGAAPIIKKIAADRNLPRPSMEGLLTAEAVADKILDCIHTPAAEVYTHRGTHEFVELSAHRREDAEHIQLAVVLGEREAYDEMKRQNRESPSH